MSWHVRVVPNRYADSVRLMGIAAEVRNRDGVERAEVVMGTPANLEQLAELGARADAGSGDVVIAVAADNDKLASPALDEAERALDSLGADDGGAPGHARPPRSLARATTELDGANLALISVPGEYATLEAHRALSSGMHVFLFSDHVPLEDELALKRRGAERGLLVMGPESGTAMLAGIGLGFANVVGRGSLGLVSAGGTGAQEVVCLLDAMGIGVSHIVGTGGRDVAPEVGGLMFREGIRLLGEDDETDTLVLVSKVPASDVIHGFADAVPEGKRVVAALVGGSDGEGPFEIQPTLEAAALAAAGVEEVPGEDRLAESVRGARSRSAGGRLLGLYSGGSLAHEALTILELELGPIAGNVGDGPEEVDDRHALLDLGEREYTQRRPHPMVDFGTRIDKLLEAADDDGLGCVLLDVVLGHGAHPDPAAELADAIGRVSEGALVLARVCGTRGDPQDSDRQAAILSEAGALVAPSNACAARLAARALAP
jgi:FdrA protein